VRRNDPRSNEGHGATATDLRATACASSHAKVDRRDHESDSTQRYRKREKGVRETASNGEPENQADRGRDPHERPQTGVFSDERSVVMGMARSVHEVSVTPDGWASVRE
jgi:hypothetical protein